MSRFDNQSVIVTGAGSGFGEAIAKRFAREGARVVVSDIDQDSGARVASEITADGGGALFIPADVSSDADVQALMEGTREAQERIDVLVNNAGYSHRQNLTWRITVEEFDAVFAVNVRGVFLGVKYAVPVMIEQGGGVIVNIASIGAIAPRPGVTPYNATKGAVLTLTKGLALEVGSSMFSCTTLFLEKNWSFMQKPLHQYSCRYSFVSILLKKLPLFEQQLPHYEILPR